MNKRIASAAMLLMAMAYGAQALSQGVYVIEGPNGPVFSDKPQAGAKEVTLKPLTVMPAAPDPKPAPPPLPLPTPVAPEKGNVPEAAVAGYRSFSVVFPENNGSVVANTAVFEVRVAVDPPLQLAEQHSIVVRINGQIVGQRYTATEFMIPPDFWGDNLPPANQSMQLDASIIDANGQVIKKAAPVRFYLRYPSMINRPQRLPRAPIVPPIVLPKPKVEPEPSSGVIIKRP